MVVDSDLPTWRDTVSAFWSSPSLGRPGRMLLVDSTLIVADRDRLHFVDIRSRIGRSVGRAGEGPGEYRSIALLVHWSADTVGVVDEGLRRLTLLNTEGRYLTTTTLALPLPYLNVRPWSNTPVRTAGGMLALLQTNMDNRQDVSVHAGLAAIPLEGGKARILREWPDLLYMNVATRYVAPRSVYYAHLHIALSASGLLAVGNGDDYCFLLQRVDLADYSVGGFRRVCREGERVPTGNAVRRPDFGILPLAEEHIKILYRVLGQQTVPEWIPSFDALIIDDQDQIWVRTVPHAIANIHPLILQWLPEEGPPFRAWDVFEEDGALVGTVELPSTFTPSLVAGGYAWGSHELPSGEVVVGRIPVRE